MVRTLEQKINEANDKLARLKTRKKKQEARQYIVLGSSLLAVGRLNVQNARTVLELLDQAKMRDSEKRDLASVVEELRGMTIKDQGVIKNER